MVGGGRWGARCEVQRGLRSCSKSSRSREVVSCGSCGELWEVVGVAGDAEGGGEWVGMRRGLRGAGTAHGT